MSTEVVAAMSAAMRRRLLAVAPHLGEHRFAAADADADADAGSEGVGTVLAKLADSVAADPSKARIWLLATAVAGGYPLREEITAIARELQLAGPGMAMTAFLAGVARTASAQRSADLEAVVLEARTLVDVDFCATSAHNTGIQRVVRSTMPFWESEHEPIFVAWSADRTGYRRLTPEQHSRALRWSETQRPEFSEPENVLVIPWNALLVLPEVPDRQLLARQSSIAENSGSRVAMIGYDAIPIVSAETVIDDESERFAEYLGVVKHATVVSCISATTAIEFQGFAAALAAQGLTGPRVSTVQLPVDVPPRVVASSAETARIKPLVLMVGSVEPRKNQHAVLGAARTLWDEGLDFELFVVGGGHSWYLEAFDRDVKRLAKAGYPVSAGRGVPDDRLALAYQQARLVVFPSLQEGYGLPVAEALATGIPVVTSEYGSTAEIAAQGGCLLVDPRSDDQIASAMRTLLTDDVVHSRLSAEAAARVDRSWADYAADLWNDMHRNDLHREAAQ